MGEVEERSGVVVVKCRPVLLFGRHLTRRRCDDVTLTQQFHIITGFHLAATGELRGSSWSAMRIERLLSEIPGVFRTSGKNRGGSVAPAKHTQSPERNPPAWLVE